MQVRVRPPRQRVVVAMRGGGRWVRPEDEGESEDAAPGSHVRPQKMVQVGKRQGRVREGHIHLYLYEVT